MKLNQAFELARIRALVKLTKAHRSKCCYSEVINGERRYWGCFADFAAAIDPDNLTPIKFAPHQNLPRLIEHIRAL